jgi:chromosomal replication initiation ATPase DnaA
MKFTTEITEENHRIPKLGTVFYSYKNGKISIYVNDILVKETTISVNELAPFIGQLDYKYIPVEEIKLREQIIKAWGVTLEQLKDATRRQIILEMRQVAQWWIKNNSKLTLNEIGGLFGGQSDSNVFCSIKKIERLKDNDKQIQKLCERINSPE